MQKVVKYRLRAAVTKKRFCNRVNNQFFTFAETRKNFYEIIILNTTFNCSKLQLV